MYLTKDNGKGSPAAKTVDVKTTDKVFHCILDLKPLAADTEFTGTLIALEAAGVKNFEVTSTKINAGKGLTSIDFKFSLPRPWPKGKYRVAIQNGNVPVKAINFDIK